ncbi:MAG: hypothetical protein DMF63_10135 [Acidobacteria bacterium]|nr:MAG: hypothetical protein DMF63_10135 [Acidobacteriota bacterium]
MTTKPDAGASFNRMKRLVLILILLGTSLAVFSQDKPLTQAEYVKMLYGLQTKPSSKSDIIDALRRRGIAFVLTDGVRGLTRSKGANDEELKRALEEAERRRVDPEGSKLPTVVETAGFIDKARDRARETIDEMPDFVVKQLITRAEAYAGTGNWKPYDTLVIAVSYSTEKGEQYRLLAQNGAPVQDSTTANSYSGLDGATSGGEFVEDLAKIFKPESKTRFDLLTTDTLRGRRALVYEYTINIENNKDGGVGLKGQKGGVVDSAPAGEKGRVWLDRENQRVLRIEYQLTDIPPSFAVKAVTKSIDYDMVEIAGEKYLLPIVSDFRGKVQAINSNRLFENRNVIRFRNYQKYGTDVIAVDEDSEPAVETKP